MPPPQRDTFSELLEASEGKKRGGLTRVAPADFPALPEAPRGTPRATPNEPMAYPKGYPADYKKRVPGLVADELPRGVPRSQKADTRAQLNIKLPLEKIFKLNQFCHSTGMSQREAIGEAIELLCSGVPREIPRATTQNATTGGVVISGSSADLIEDREILSIIEFYKDETGNEWTPGDQAALEELNGRVRVEFISAGIIKSLIGCRGRVNTFTYCARTANQIATDPSLGDGKGFLVDLWRRYERAKESVQRKQRSAG